MSEIKYLLPWGVTTKAEMLDSRQRTLQEIQQTIAEYQAGNHTHDVFNENANLETYFADQEIRPIVRMALGKYGLGLDMSGGAVVKFPEANDDSNIWDNAVEYFNLFLKYLNPDFLPDSIEDALTEKANH